MEVCSMRKAIVLAAASLPGRPAPSRAVLGAPTARTSPIGAWTGQRLLVWGTGRHLLMWGGTVGVSSTNAGIRYLRLHLFYKE
jgi:hypothetical protein